ncbi:MAG: hypothetical protein LUD47_00530 [Clostridia bacterium]|nr:hypothetical protein [Clostridia bacterium]
MDYMIDDGDLIYLELKGGVVMRFDITDPSYVSFEDEDGTCVLLYDAEKGEVSRSYYSNTSHEYNYGVTAKQKKQDGIAMTFANIIRQIVEYVKQ